ncbi:MAG: LPS export ABC transporter periplasmic protein LptC [Paludibacteraceae bacterium]|nr:LPS export ABC transporter periplasmic protein LptC [Paludibacteraceae bacterium]MBR1787086.1 LPS export ABC transporter periplasmic protein LptC [Paludibacteraceae bacterium]
MVLLLCFITSCEKDFKPRIAAIANRAEMPSLKADTVTTLISDSGITRYRITTPRWEIYDKADPSHWEFPQGVYLERFAEDLSTEASLKADYAYYNEKEQLWHLKGNVHALNLKGEEFSTPDLYWSQQEESVYSDTIMEIKKSTSIIKGIGFRSNQQMTEYTILQPTGVFPIDEEENK